MNTDVKYPCTYDALPSLTRHVQQQKKARRDANLSFAVWLLIVALMIALI